MTTISQELVKKRAEHNNGHLSTLEEVSLHQEHITKIDGIQYWCKHLKILLLQGNLIFKIENLWKLKELEYLNLALNNIEKVENLEGCESLNKLDLMVNFISDLKSVRSLEKNYNLKTLILEGNPCTEYKGYRDYVITVLPQLEVLDNLPIKRSERILALDRFIDIETEIKRQQIEYIEKRRAQKQSLKKSNDKSDNCEEKTDSENGQCGASNSKPDSYEENEKNEFNIEKAKRFWEQPSTNTPEERMLIAEQIRKFKKDNTVQLSSSSSSSSVKRKILLFAKDGRPLNVNEAKVPFTLTEDENTNEYVLTVQVYKYIDTDELDVDVQPGFVRVLIKKKVLQLVLSDEVKTECCQAQRSMASKNLVITMPKLSPKDVYKKETQEK